LKFFYLTEFSLDAEST